MLDITKISLLDILSISIVLFAIIDILGSIPILIDLQEKKGKINPLKTSVISLIILVMYLFLGEKILLLFNVTANHFAIAGSFIMFFFAIEMILGIKIFNYTDSLNSTETSLIIPISFPLIAGAGTFTTLLSLRANYNIENIVIGLFLNIIFVFIVLKYTYVIKKLLGPTGLNITKQFFGIIILTISIKLFVDNLIIVINNFNINLIK